MKYNRNKRLIIVMSLATILLVGVLSTYAYFTGSSNNEKRQEAELTAGTMKLIFADGNNGIKETLNLGDSVTKTFSIENTGNIDATAAMYFDNLINTYLEGSLTYTLSYSETENGEYEELITNRNVPRSEDNASIPLSEDLLIPAGTKYYYKLTIMLNDLEDVNQNADINAIFISKFKLVQLSNKALMTLTALGLKAKVGNPDFSMVSTTDETKDGLYSMEDDYGTSYYYRGAVENNYVKFAGFYWRIIRINGDGSLKIAYDGTKAHANGETNGDRVAIQNIAYNIDSNDNKYIGYMFSPLGTAASTSKEQAQTNEIGSNIKAKLDEWYKNNIVDNGYIKYVEDVIFCNDRSTPGKDVTGWGYDTGLGYGTNKTAYGSTNRIINTYSYPWSNKIDASPILKCPQKNDAFTVNDTEKGNGALTYPVGLITADETVLAGTINYEESSINNTNFYLFKGINYWTISPRNYDVKTYILMVNNIGNLKYVHSNSGQSIVPVINIKSEYARGMIGDGTISNPYRLS